MSDIEIGPESNVPRKIQFTAEQWLVYSTFDLSIHVLQGQANQLAAAHQEPAARILIRIAQQIAEKRDKYLAQQKSGLVVVGADQMPEGEPTCS